MMNLKTLIVSYDTINDMKPPYSLTDKIIKLVSEISKSLGKIEASGIAKPSPKLRKNNQIKTIKSTLAIEGNTLSLEQITAILEGKKVIGPSLEIQEVKNAISLYEQIEKYKFTINKDFLLAHKALMTNILKSAGKYRQKNVGILKAKQVSHIAPKPVMVPELMANLFKWLRSSKELSPLIKSCIAHYEIEFIHPFEDGNGRVGRFWQTLILSSFDPIFKYIPIENLIEKKQLEYYKALEQSDLQGESTIFIEFMLEVILKALEEFSKNLINTNLTANDRLSFAKFKLLNEFSRREYMELFKNVSTATASRDLKEGLESKLLKKIGEKNQTRYIFK